MTFIVNGWPRKAIGHLFRVLCYIKLCVSFHSHLWIQTGVTIRNRPNWGKICFDLCDLDLWPLTLTFCMDITFVNGNNSWKFHDDTMIGTLWTRRSENNNTPQPLDQWTNSPFMGQQVGNCKSFRLTHYLADPFAMHWDPRASPSWIRHCIQIASFLFQVDQPSHS